MFEDIRERTLAMAMYEMTITVEIPEDFGTFQVMESKILEASRTVARNLLIRVMGDFEDWFCSKKAVSKKDRREKKFETVFGVVPVNRWRVFDVFKKKCVYPLDQWMQLEGWQKVSPNLSTQIVELCTQTPYARATDTVNRETGVKRSSVGNWKLVQAVSLKSQAKEAQEKIPDWKEKGLPELKQEQNNPCPILAVDPDATYVRARKKTDKKHEIKMAVIYTARKRMWKGKKPKGKTKKTASGQAPKARYVLVNKQVVIPPVNSSADDLFNSTTHKAVMEYGMNHDSRVVCHGDGDPWIKRFKTDYCPQALNRLDPWHVFKKIREATDVEKIPKEWYESFYTNPVSLIGKLRVFKKQLADKKDQERVDQLINYLTNNIEGMKPSGVPKQIKDQYPRMYRRGSGTIESNIFAVIGQRFKAPRMSWSESGLNNLCFLRQQYLNRSYSFQKVKVQPEHYKKMRYIDELRELVKDL